MNFGAKALQVLKTVAPTLATAVGGPFGAIASAAISAALGTPANDAKAAEEALLSATPETLAAVQKANQDFQVRMKELGISEEKLVYDDIANARQMQVATRDPTVSRLAWLVTGGFIFMCLILATAFIVLPEQTAKISIAAWTLLTTLVVQLGNEAKQAGSFFFGSSSGSKDKDDTIAQIAKGP